MAAGIALAVIRVLGPKLGEMASNQASLVVNFTTHLEGLTEELTKIADDLNDADSHTIQNKRVKRWIQRVRDVAWDAEDIIEECSLKWKSSQSSSLYSYMRIIFHLKFRYNMGRRIKDVRQRMMSITQDASRAEIVHKMINLNNQPSTSRSETLQEVQKPLSRLDSKSPHVAIEDKVDHILRLLQKPEFPVIAIVGMGGVGKTFLLQHVYSSAKQRFAKSIWLSISQKYSIARLQADVASHIKEWQHENMHLQDIVNGHLSVERAAELIYRCLENAEALVVLDDVWRVDGGNDLISILGLPMGQNSKCKIMVTTRSKEVAKMMSASYIYQMKVLSDKESWKLFCSYAFPDCPENRPQCLEAAAHAVERECGNLPLAIKTVGASMAHKTLQRDWESKSSQLKKVSTLLDSADPIMSILRLSYDSLPAHLKPCFLYLAFFGEDEKIDPEYLVSCWMAEGFIPEGEGQWELALNYLYQLNTLCLVDVEEDKWLNKYCKVHDLLLDLAISIRKENKCAVVVEEAGTNNPSADGSSSGCRRILLAKKGIDNNAIANLHFPRFLRTLSLSLNHKIEYIPANLFSSVRALRVIDLSHTRLSTLPKSFGNLKLLRVLNLSRTQVMEVPECVRNLKSLCFLDLSFGGIRRLPAWIGEL